MIILCLGQRPETGRAVNFRVFPFGPPLRKGKYGMVVALPGAGDLNFEAVDFKPSLSFCEKSTGGIGRIEQRPAGLRYFTWWYRREKHLIGHATTRVASGGRDP